MKKFIIGMAVLAAFGVAGQAMALDITGTVGKTKATSQAAAQSSSGVIGGSALLGTTSIVTGNASNASGVVQATNGNQQSTVAQQHSTNSTSVLGGSSLGLAGSVGGAGGAAESVGAGLAVQKQAKIKVSLW